MKKFVLYLNLDPEQDWEKNPGSGSVKNVYLRIRNTAYNTMPSCAYDLAVPNPPVLNVQRLIPSPNGLPVPPLLS